MLRTRAVHELMLRAVTGAPFTRQIVAGARAASPRLWRRALRIEQCAPALERALRARNGLDSLPEHARELVRETSARALRTALAIPQQTARIAAIASAHGIEIVALKGAARLLRGELPGARTVDDIDLLVRPHDAARLHALLADALRCERNESAPAHHLPTLYPGGGVPVELHLRLSDGASPLDALIWSDATPLSIGGASVLIPSATTLCLHTLDHAVLTHWGMRYRLRDVLDVASAWNDDVVEHRVLRHVRSSSARRAMETLLGAAAMMQPDIPIRRRTAWRTIARVGRARLAISLLSRDPRRAERLLTVGSVTAEGSSASLRRLATVATRALRSRLRAATLPSIVVGLLAGSTAGCGDATGGGSPAIPNFVFASTHEGAAALYRYEDGTIDRLTTPGNGDDEPHTAAGRIVFTSTRHGNPEILMMSLDGAPPRRLTTHASSDGEPALRNDASMVAFVSSRSGTPRVWVVDTLGGAPVALETGSATFVPERAPAWSPTGDRLAFTSTRTGTSQVWVVSASGGTATQVTHESEGAFDPSWSTDGSAIFYAAVGQLSRVMRVELSSGIPVIVGEDPLGVGQPACARDVCVAVRRAYSDQADIVAFGSRSTPALDIVVRTGADHRPALLVP